MLAGVAFGCAQIGWRLVEPASASVPLAPMTSDAIADDAMASFQSPFAPAAKASSRASAPSAVGAIRLVGVRMSDQEQFSGAVLTFGDDLQRPFLVGQTISDGVQLAHVYADHIVVSFGAGEQSIALEQSGDATRSLALALMGKSTLPEAGVVHQADLRQPALETVAAPAVQAVSLPEKAASSGDTQWLLSTMGAVEYRNGAPYGWRVATVPPAVLGERGLATGDLIVSINGARPGDNAAVLAAARANRLELVIERASGERATVTIANGFAS